jgi:hypothetical protein
MSRYAAGDDYWIDPLRLQVNSRALALVQLHRRPQAFRLARSM